MGQLRKDVLAEAVMTINRWHPNTPLLLVFSRQKPGPEGTVLGNVESVRDAYDSLFNLDQIGIQDASRKYYLHFCHGPSGAKDFPFAIKKPTDNYGKTHQRIIKDTFANPEGFLTRVSEGKYNLKAKAESMILKYLDAEGPIDLRPLVLLHYWNSSPAESKIVDLWKRFSAAFSVDEPPFNNVFTCSGLSDLVQLAPDGEDLDMRQLCLPSEYGSGAMGSEFWNRFRAVLEDKLKKLKWQGRPGPMVAGITSGLMQDQAVFLLGAPGTGKTTLVTDAILPALREAYGTENNLKFSEFQLTPSSTSSDVFGFQGLDGGWVKGPFVRDVMVPYAAGTASAADTGEGAAPSEDEEEIPSPPPHLVFFDEANRVDIEGLLAPVQAALDRMQARKPGGVITLGKDQYVLPAKVWRIFAGNSPATDIGRKEQSRPLKRRLSVVLPPDPMDEVVSSSMRFRGTCLDLLERASRIADVERSEPALGLLGDLKTSSDRIEDLRVVLEAVRALPQVAVTVGLVESILLRASSHKALRQDAPLDAALAQTLVGLIAGDVAEVERVAQLAKERGFSQLDTLIMRDIIQAQQTDGRFEIAPLL
ncbi:MAG: AAA family ATPase [Rhodospirillaceae bacterium]